MAQKQGAGLPKPLAVSQGAWSAPQPLSAGSGQVTPHYSWQDRHPERVEFSKRYAGRAIAQEAISRK
jgi:hypothetical protein